MRSYHRLVGVENIASTPEYKCVHLGCGDILLNGWCNVDFYCDHERITKWKLDNLECPSNYFEVAYSCHALEHVGFNEIQPTLNEWFRVLKPGGCLYLSVPDLGRICDIFHDNPNWFIRCIYGLQTGPGHFHKWGFTEKSLRTHLLTAGFDVTFFERIIYGNTPSFWVEAQK